MTNISCSAYCSRCGKDHFLPEGQARMHCIELMKMLESKKRIDLMNPDEKADYRFSTDYLFGEARGQMFGIMMCRDKNKETVLLRAFSGQYNGIWELDGWVPPVLDVNEFYNVSRDVDREIKDIGNHMKLWDSTSPERQTLVRERKYLSQKLMTDIHSLYNLANFRGEIKSLCEVFGGKGGIPSGTADCCAPKLLNHAARNKLVPISMAEFYWGKENRSRSRSHSRFYPVCKEKCRPILGYMLCGLEELHEQDL